MNDLTDKKSNGSSEGECNCDFTLAFLVLRLWLAVRAILAGVEKFGVYQTIQKPLVDPTTGMEDPSGAMIDVKVKYYAITNYAGVPAPLKDKFANEPMLPHGALTAFDQCVLGLGVYPDRRHVAARLGHADITFPPGIDLRVVDGGVDFDPAGRRRFRPGHPCGARGARTDAGATQQTCYIEEMVNQTKPSLTRREFIGSTAAVGAGLMLASGADVFGQSNSPAASVAPGNKLRVALIGFGAEGRVLLESLLKIQTIQLVAICDIWDYARNYGQRYLKVQGVEVNAYENYEDLLGPGKRFAGGHRGGAGFLARAHYEHLSQGRAACVLRKDDEQHD